VKVFVHAQEALNAVRRDKALNKKPVKAVITLARLPQGMSGLLPAARDFQAAAHVRQVSFENITDAELTYEAAPAEGTPA
jgi:hypothetical protein